MLLESLLKNKMKKKKIKCSVNCCGYMLEELVYSLSLSIIPSSAMKKMHLKMLSAKSSAACKILTSRTNFGIQTNSVDPDQTVLSGSTLFATEIF